MNENVRAFSDPYFPISAQNRIRISPYPYLYIPNRRKYGYDYVHIRQNTDHGKPVFRHISHSERTKSSVLTNKTSM